MSHCHKTKAGKCLCLFHLYFYQDSLTYKVILKGTPLESLRFSNGEAYPVRDQRSYGVHPRCKP